jgi:hypothetical protein
MCYVSPLGIVQLKRLSRMAVFKKISIISSSGNFSALPQAIWMSAEYALVVEKINVRFFECMQEILNFSQQKRFALKLALFAVPTQLDAKRSTLRLRFSALSFLSNWRCMPQA